MVYFKKILPTVHYLREHEREVPWEKVVEIILTTKDPRKNNDLFEIDTNEFYVVFSIKEGVLYVINAKRK